MSEITEVRAEDWNLEGPDHLSAIFLEYIPSADMHTIEENKILTKTWELTTQVKNTPNKQKTPP